MHKVNFSCESVMEPIYFFGNPGWYGTPRQATARVAEPGSTAGYTGE
jgi:hypothetical protein